MAYSHLSQMDEDNTLVIGDSIIEGLFTDSFGRCKIVPVGFGGGTLSTVLGFLEDLKVEASARTIDLSHIRSIVILIGVNDSRQERPRTQEYLESWNESYGDMLDVVLDLGVDTVLVSTFYLSKKICPLAPLFLIQISSIP